MLCSRHRYTDFADIRIPIRANVFYITKMAQNSLQQILTREVPGNLSYSIWIGNTFRKSSRHEQKIGSISMYL